MPLDIPVPLDTVARPPRPGNLLIGWLPDPRFVAILLRRGTRRERYRWFSVPLSVAARRLHTPSGSESMARQVSPARPKRMVTSTPCRSSPHHETVQTISRPTRKWFPDHSQEVESARLRGLAPSTSPLRHISVRRSCRALLPWVSFSRTPAASRQLEPSQARAHPAPTPPSRPEMSRPNRDECVCPGSALGPKTWRREKVRQRTRSTDSRGSR